MVMRYFLTALVLVYFSNASTTQEIDVPSASVPLDVTWKFQLDLNPNELVGIPPNIDKGLKIVEEEAGTYLLHVFDGVEEVTVKDPALPVVISRLSDEECLPVMVECTHAIASSSWTVDSAVKLTLYKEALVAKSNAFVDKFNTNVTHKDFMFLRYLGPNYVVTGVDLLFEWNGSERILQEQDPQVSRIMGDNEKTILTEAMVRLIPVVGTANVTLAEVYAQHTQRKESTWKGDATIVRIIVKGVCDTGCDQEDFAMMYDTALGGSLELLVNEVQLVAGNSTDYFEKITVTRISSRNEDDGDIVALELLDDPVEEEEFPWWIIGALLGVIVVVGGTAGYGFYRKRHTAVTAVDVISGSEPPQSIHDDLEKAESAPEAPVDGAVEEWQEEDEGLAPVEEDDDVVQSATFHVYEQVSL